MAMQTAWADNSGASVSAAVGELASAVQRQAAHTLDLLSVEARLAALGFAGMISALVIAGVFALTAWGLLVTFVVLALLGAGWTLQYALLALGVTHVAGVYCFWRVALRLSGRLDFRAIRRQLRLTDVPEAERPRV